MPRPYHCRGTSLRNTAPVRKASMRGRCTQEERSPRISTVPHPGRLRGERGSVVVRIGSTRVGAHRRVLVAAAALAAGAVATGGMLAAQGSSSSSGHTGIRLTGTFTLFTSAQPQAKPCAPHAGYTDIANGAPVVIRDQRGVTVGSGSLSSGSPEP